MPGRNEPCPCGSGKKYKRCHGVNSRRSHAVEPSQLVLERANNMARKGHLDQAIVLLHDLPANAATLSSHARLLRQRGTKHDLQKADRLLIHLQRLLPHSAEPRLQRAEIRWKEDDSTEALRLVIAAGKIAPGHAQVEYYLGVALQLAGKLETACSAYRKSILKNIREPISDPELDIDIAIQAYETAAGHYPGSTVADESQLVNAEAEYDALNSALRNWLESGPDLSQLSKEKITRYSNAFYNLGCSDMVRFNHFEEAGQHFHDCLSIKPDHLEARCNLLYLLNYNNKIDSAAISKAHFDSAQDLREQMGRPESRFGNNPDPDKIIRVGYLSSDFRKHSVIYFITGVLAAHNRNRFQVHAYYNGRQRDHWTREVQSLVDVMHPVALMSDSELHQKITADEIDILVDLNGYTKGNRAAVLMRRAAPVQVNWIGYPNTTGMDVMDYRIVDPTTDPEESQPGCSEALIHMPEIFSAYMPDPEMPAIAAQTPALENGYVTFGSFNHLPKLNPEMLESWSKILSAVPDSRLLIKNVMLSQPVIVRDMQLALDAAGIDRARVLLEGRTESVQAHLSFFNNVDLCFDSWPYNGTTTTCDSLFMGVPVLTIAGDSHRSRVSASQLTAVGLHKQLVAADAAEYVKIATRLADDHMMLNNLRQGLRERVQQSPLMDAKGFTRELENRYHRIWNTWCAEETRT